MITPVRGLHPGFFLAGRDREAAQAAGTEVAPNLRVGAPKAGSCNLKGHLQVRTKGTPPWPGDSRLRQPLEREMQALRLRPRPGERQSDLLACAPEPRWKSEPARVGLDAASGWKGRG